MHVQEHPGNCCGVDIIHGFDHATVADLDRCIAECRDNGAGDNRLIMVVLSERQVRHHNDMPENRRGMADRISAGVRRAGGWPAVLANRGFKLMERFNNSNSRQNCYVFFRINQSLPIDDRNLPFNWEGERQNGVRGNANNMQQQDNGNNFEERQYYAVFRDGHERGVFPTLEALREAYPRVGRYRLKTYSNNGVRDNGVRRLARGGNN